MANIKTPTNRNNTKKTGNKRKNKEAMTITEIQNSLIRKILNTDNISILTQVEKALSDTKTVAYDSNSVPLTAQQYKTELDIVINEVETKQDNGFTTEEIRKHISNAYHLE